MSILSISYRLSPRIGLGTHARCISSSTNPFYGIKMGDDQPRYYVPNTESEEVIKYRTHGTSFYSLKMDKKFRLGNLPMYQNPLINFVIGSKRLSLAFGVIGCMFAYLMDRTGLIWVEFSQIVAIFSVLPFPIVTYLYEPYVSRIWRVYDTSKPQTLENLTTDEMLIIEKLNWSGFKSYNELVRVNSLQVPKSINDYRGRFGFVNLLSIDEKLKSTKAYFINNGFTNIKMDRILSIAEKRSDVTNTGRNFYSE